MVSPPAQHAARPHLRHRGGAADAGVLQVRDPAGQILHGGEQARRAGVGVAEHGVPEAAVAGGGVRVGAAGDQVLVVVVEVGGAHPQRREDAALHPRREGLARGAGDDLRQQRVPHVGVHVLGTGREVEFALLPEELEDVVPRDHVVQPPPGQRQQLPLVAEPAGVVDQVPQRDRVPEVGDLRHPPPHVVVQRERPLLRQQRRREGGELLGDGGDVEDGGRRDRDVVLQVGVPVPAREDDLPVADDGHGGTRRSGAVPRGEEGVHLPLRGERGRGRLRGEGRRGGAHGERRGREERTSMHHRWGIGVSSCRGSVGITPSGGGVPAGSRSGP
jgi:hypothetical protein